MDALLHKVLCQIALIEGILAQLWHRWAQMARSGKKAMQFLSEGRYVAIVVDGKVNFYGRGERKSQAMQ